MTSASYRQPWLHDRQIAVLGNATVLSAPDGALGAVGTGLLVDDRLVLATFALTLGAPGQWEAPHVISSTSRGAVTSLWACARNVGDAGPDPSVEVHTQREVVGGGLREQICVVSRSHRPVQTRIRLEIGSAAADLAQVKAGRLPCDAPTLKATSSGFTWFDRRHRTTVQATPQPARDDAGRGRAERAVPVEHQDRQRCGGERVWSHGRIVPRSPGLRMRDLWSCETGCLHPLA